MKLLELITEKRKNYLTKEIIHDLHENSFAEIYSIHFSDTEKLGINPKPSYTNTPLGIYAYPLKQSWEYYGKNLGKYPFAFDRKYVFLIKLSNNAKIFNLSDKAKNEDATKFKTYFSDENIKKIFNEKTSEYIESILNREIKLNDDIYFYVFNIFKKIFDESKISIELNKFFRNVLKYDVIVDEGFGRIHPHEPVQLVILNPRSIETYKIYDNPIHLHIKKYI